MLVPDYDDYGHDDDCEAKPLVKPVDEYIIDHFRVRLYCKICRVNHHTNVKGPLPVDGSAPCFECWSRYYLPVLTEEQSDEEKEPAKPAAPRAVASPTGGGGFWGHLDDLDLEEAYGYFCFGI